MYILGISGFYHDSAACLISSGKIVAAAQEERFTRKKNDASFPHSSILYCLDEAGVSPERIENVVFYEKPFLKFERLLETYFAFAPKGFRSFMNSMPLWVKEKLFQKSMLKRCLSNTLGFETSWNKKLLFSDHHLSHAASAFYPSPFKDSAVLCLDGVGEWATSSMYIGEENRLTPIQEIHFPHSLGLLYSAFTYYTGFKVNSGEYKLMGLAPYGQPRYAQKIRKNLITIASDGSFFLNMKYFNFATGLTMTNKNFNDLFGGVPRLPETEITQREMDIAASVQEIVEEVLILMAKYIRKKSGQENLCLAGGVALNCVANGRLLKEKVFKNVWVQPASGDAGGAVGAALSAWHLHYLKPRTIPSKKDGMAGSLLGPAYSDSEIEIALKSRNANFKIFSEKDLIEFTSDALIQGKAIGWMQGRMEFGPRALGNRSIIADPRSPKMQKQLNLKVKFRESFRPFAPSITREALEDWFDLEVDSPYMLFVADLKEDRRQAMTKKEKSLFGIEKLNVPRSSIPAVTHVDYSARVQTVSASTNPLFHSLISRFCEKTTVPILVNTSFNVRGEPIVCTPTDAYNCFLRSELDILVIGKFVLLKEEQDNSSKMTDVGPYELD